MTFKDNYPMGEHADGTIVQDTKNRGKNEIGSVCVLCMQAIIASMNAKKMIS
jgi:hypothetical protein